MKTIDELLARLDKLSATDQGPFPYRGCRYLQDAAADGRREGFAPDLDSYLSELAGYRSWGRRILRWPSEKAATVERRVTQSFFDRYPAYADLEPLLNSPAAADVKQRLDVADETRAILTELLGQLRRITNAVDE